MADYFYLKKLKQRNGLITKAVDGECCCEANSKVSNTRGRAYKNIVLNISNATLLVVFQRNIITIGVISGSGKS